MATERNDKQNFQFAGYQGNWLKGVIADIHPTVRLGRNTVVWSFAVICEGVTVGDDCVIGSRVFVGKGCKIGNGVRIQDGAHLTPGMIVEDDVFIGPMVVTMNDKYPKVRNPNYEARPPHLSEGCSIGAGAVLLPGIRVGKYASIGAGAVVTKDVPDGMIVVGNPAKTKKVRRNL